MTVGLEIEKLINYITIYSCKFTMSLDGLSDSIGSNRLIEFISSARLFKYFFQLVYSLNKLRTTDALFDQNINVLQFLFTEFTTLDNV